MWRAGSHAPERALNPVAAGAEAGPVLRSTKHLTQDLAQDWSSPGLKDTSALSAKAVESDEGGPSAEDETAVPA